MAYMRMSIGAMVVALLTMLVCLISFSPFTMALFMTVGLGSAAVGLGLFTVALIRGWRMGGRDCEE